MSRNFNVLFMRNNLWNLSKLCCKPGGSSNVSGCFISEAYLSTLQKSNLGHTTLLLQEGTSIQELPMVVRNLHDKDIDLVCTEPVINKKCLPKIEQIEEDLEAQEMVVGFEQCYSAKGVFKLLELIPAEEVTPKVALQALKSIFRMENNQEFRNMVGWDTEEKSENFTRMAILTNLTTVLVKSEDSQILLEGLMAISRDVTSGKLSTFRDMLCDEVLLRVSDGKFTVTQVCHAVRAFALLDRKSHADKLWTGLFGKENEVDITNIMDVFRTLPYLRQSRRLVLSMTEKKLSTLWHELNGSDVAELLQILHNTKCLSQRVVRIFSGWLSTNIHRVSEQDLLLILSGFCQASESEQGVDRALERYVKAKGLKIGNPTLFVSIMDYCKKFKVRSPLILDGCAEYIIQKRQQLSPSQMASLFSPFGVLDYHPAAGNNFWHMFEEELYDRFVQLHPSDALDVMLSCVYLEKHPLNFIRKVFNPYFLDRLHSVQQPMLLAILRKKLKILDTALTLECSSYRGPLLPRDHSAKALFQDGRIRRVVAILTSALKGSIDGYMSSSVILTQLPLAELYVVDVLLHPKPLESSHVSFVQPRTMTAVLIRVPEHFDSSGKHLLGAQVMRRRHLQAVGLTIVELDLNTMLNLRHNPTDVISYYKEQSDVALPPRSNKH